METDQGFILKKTNYSETSAVLQVFTLKEGLMSFYFPGAKKKNQVFLRPLAHISFQYRKRGSGEQMPMLTKPEEENLWQNIYFDPVKSCQLYFINEVLHNSMAPGDTDENLFHFVLESMQLFEKHNQSANFHLYFTAHLTKFLGFFPEFSENAHYFDLYHGQFKPNKPMSDFYEKGKHTEILQQIFQSNPESFGQIEMKGKLRNELSHVLVKYYQTQLEGFRPPKSLEILEAVFG